jgi:hypothetical protein
MYGKVQPPWIFRLQRVHGTSLLEGISPSLHTMQRVALLAEDIDVTELESSKALDFYE